VELSEALDFARARRQGVLVTIRGNGRAQLSNVLYLMGDDGVAEISITADRAKTKNLRRDPRASLYIVGDSFWAYVVLEGTVELSEIASDPHDEVVERLVSYYRRAQGEHPDWDEYRRAMVNDHRVVARFTPEHAYGLVSPQDLGAARAAPAGSG
jgi:PPOX class probable F420-dependent enzyme